MDRPQVQANSKAVQPPPRRRIVPVAVAPQDQAPSLAAFDAEQPLVVPPPPAKGSSRTISASGQGRRIWVDIHSSIEVKFKEVLKQQGLEYKTWRAAMQQRRAQQDTAAGAQGGDARRHGLSAAGVYQRTQGMYEVLDDDEEEEDEDDDDEDDSCSEGPAAEGAGEEGDAAGSSGDNDEDDDEDDEEDDKGNDTAGEVDLEKEEAAARKAAKPKRQRFERYDDDFIDDSELEMVKGGGPTKTKFSGFYVTQGNVETIEEPSKPRAKPKPRQPRNPDAAAAAAAGGSGPGRKRTQPEKAQEQQEQQQQQQQHKKKQQQQQQQQEGDPAAAGGKKKRQRSETPAGAAAAAAAAAQDKPPAGKKAKPTPVPPAAAAAAAAQQQPAADSADAAGPPAPAAAAAAAAATGASTSGTSAQAMAAIRAAVAAKKKAPAADSKATAASGAAAAAQAAAPAAADSSKPKEQQQQAAASKQGQQPAEQLAAAASGPAAAAAAEPAVDAAEAAAAAAAGGAVAAATAAGLPGEVVAAVEALQREVAEHKPPAPGGPGKSAGMSKAVRHALDNIGLVFARLPAQVKEQQTAALVSSLGPLMLPYFKEKKLRRILLEEAASRAGELQDTRQALFRQLEACSPAGGMAGAGGAGDEDFQPHMSAAAEEALAAAWAAHQASPEQLTQLAVDVCGQLGWANVQPDKAVAELKQLIKQAKKRMSKSKAATPAAAAAAGALSQQPSLQRQLSGGLNSSRQSPEPPAAAGGDTSGGGTPGLTPQRQQQPPLGLAPIALASQAHSGGAAGSGSASQKQPAEKFSTLQAPSPRLQRCLDAAVAAGAPLNWLQEKYPSLRSKHMHQIFRTLCVSGPAGCTIRAMVGRAADHGLNVAWEDSTAARSALKQSLAGHIMSAVAGTTEADSKAYALLCFPGVRKQPAKPPKAAPDAAAGGAGQAAAE